LLREMRRRADAAGWLRLALPAEFGGQDASNLKMAIIREHLAHKGLGCTTTSRTSRRSSATSRRC
jgi:acyl-CoA dehydrogenase